VAANPHLTCLPGRQTDATKPLDKLVPEAGRTRAIGTTATVGKLLTEYIANLERLGKAQSTMETYLTHIARADDGPAGDSQ
jgi:hypothetical protein